MSGPRYVAVAAEALLYVPLDGLTAVFHRASGGTHLLASPAPEILDALAVPATISELLARLAAAYDLGDTDAPGLAARLDELVAIGLVAPA